MTKKQRNGIHLEVRLFGDDHQVLILDFHVVLER